MSAPACLGHAVRVELPGHGEFIFLVNEDGSGPLAPLDHVDENGDINIDWLWSLSDTYAHVLANGTIKRYRVEIANRTDLVERGKCPKCQAGLS